MIIALIALVLSFFAPTNSTTSAVVIIPAQPQYAPTNAIVTNEDEEWELYNQEAYYDYAAQFTALYSSYTYKVSKNGRSMVNGKFVKMGNK
jgi:hypothetical protein